MQYSTLKISFWPTNMLNTYMYFLLRKYKTRHMTKYKKRTYISQKYLRDKSIWIAIYQKDYGIIQTVNISLDHLPCVRQVVLLLTTLSLWLVERSNHCGDIGNMTLRIPVKAADVDVHWVGRPRSADNRSWLSLLLMAPIYACINKGYSLLAVGDATDVTRDQWIYGGTICRIRTWWRRKTHAENCLQFFRIVSTE